MKQFLIIFTTTATILVACKNSEKPQNSPTTIVAPIIELPKTPEEVVRTWEAGIGKNDFAFAKLISSGEALKTVVSLDSTNKIETIPPLNTRILTMNCRENGEKATCDCLLEDEEGQIRCTYFLVRQGGQWRVADADSKPVENVNKKPVK